MFKTLLTLILLLNIQLTINAQDNTIDARAAAIPKENTASVDALAAYIKQNFTNDTARVRAIYVWIANHINYDLQRLKKMDSDPTMSKQTVENVLSTRNAVCQGYSDLFVALCKNLGINASVISGYTKQQGKISPVSHAWVAVQLNGDWQLYDPTWGAGFVKDDKFVKRFNNTFYKVQPSVVIADHMPFDPVYQFLSNPISNKDFINGTPAATNTVFNYKDSLLAHEKLSVSQQMSAELRRLEASGILNDLLLKRQQYLKNNLQSFASKDAFEEGGKAYKVAIDLYKEYINHKNKQFTTIADNDLKQMVDSMVHYVKLSRYLLIEAVPKSDAQRDAKANNVSNLDRFWAQLTKEKQFTEAYIVADASARKNLFSRR